MLKHISRLILLKDFYGPLLTEKQQYVLGLFYEDDWSLAEIAEELIVSRQAVHDILKRAESQLEYYEKRLGLVDKFERTRSQLQELSSLLNCDDTHQEKINQAIEILQELSELV